MRSDFCVMILTHGSPDRVKTFEALKRQGYTGPVFLVIDDEDKRGDEYREKFGKAVVTFSKIEATQRSDEGDNSDNRSTPLYARNESFRIAKELGYRYFVQLDDDYSGFFHRFNGEGKYGWSRVTDLDGLFEVLTEFLCATPILTIAMSQGGDHIGGDIDQKLSRKAMNSFFCDVERPFLFRGRLNDDVSTYVEEGRRGQLFFTATAIQLNQEQTQAKQGGITDAYLELGTYAKSFSTVMYAPSCTLVSQLGDNRSPHYRIHHDINWERVAPKILQESWRKPDQMW